MALKRKTPWATRKLGDGITPKPKIVHAQREIQTYCWRNGVSSTRDRSKVTCKECLKKLKILFPEKEGDV